MNTTYDSSEDTSKHINRVRILLDDFIDAILYRTEQHDQSKLLPPEKEIFDIVTPRLKTLTYNSEEYKKSLKEMGTALEHHYKHNRHHPEHFPNGISDMTLIDVLEMLCDWKAATERHTDGNLYTSLEINKKRFNIDGQLYSILLNTVEANFEE